MSPPLLRNIQPRRQEVYEEFGNLLLSKSGKSYRRYSNNLVIPNILRTTDLEMEIYLERLSSSTTKTIKELCTGMHNGTIELHVISETILIFGKDRLLSNKISKFTSWTITPKDMELCIRAVTEPAVVAIELRKYPQKHYNPKRWRDSGNLEGSQYNPSEEDYKQRKSFIRKRIDMDKINDYLLFMDGEFACKMADGSKAPLSISILNGYGKTILNTLITPRHRIIKLADHVHGLEEIHLRNRMDEYEALKKIRSLCRGKILVGHDLQMELNNLCIDKQSLLGIRDLAGAKAFHEKFNLSPKSGGQFYKLQTLATSILKIEIQQPGKHNSMEDTKAIMDLYRTIEDSYIDDIHFNHEDLRWKIPVIVGDVEHSQPKKFKCGLPAIMWPSPSIQREPIENVIMAWQDEVDLDVCENLVIAQDIDYETLQPAMFQSTSNSLMPSTSNYAVEIMQLKLCS